MLYNDNITCDDVTKIGDMIEIISLWTSTIVTGVVVAVYKHNIAQVQVIKTERQPLHYPLSLDMRGVKDTYFDEKYWCFNDTRIRVILHKGR